MSRPAAAVLLLGALLIASLAVNLHWWRGAQQSQHPDVGDREGFNAITDTGQGRPVPSPAREPPLQLSAADLQLLFDAGDYADALAGLAWLQGRHRVDANTLKKSWLATAREWLQAAAQDQRAMQFVEAALDSDANDFDYRRLEADRLAANGEVLRAIDRYYELLNESPQQLQGVLAADIQRLVKAEVTELSEARAWPVLIRLAERLLWHEPMHPPWVFIYARALVQEGRYASARNSLQTVLYDEYYGARAREMLEQVERLELPDESIPLQRSGAHYVVRGRLNGDDEFALMIDTGATLSVISPSALRAANVSPEPVFVRNATINTAGGKVRAPIYRVESFSIGNYSVPNMEFVLLELGDSAGGAGLLGMNFLRNFSFQLDQQNDRLLLAAPQ